MKGFKAILAADEKLGIGKDGDLAWHAPGDLSYFKRLTLGEGNNAVIMGRRTWESIPPKWRPLKSRHNIVLTTNRSFSVQEKGAEIAFDFDSALALAQPFDAIWVVGGAALYALAFAHPKCQAIHITCIEGDFACDTFCPPFEDRFTLDEESAVQHDHEVSYRFTVWTPR